MRRSRVFGVVVLVLALVGGLTVGLPPVPVAAAAGGVSQRSVPVTAVQSTPSALPVSNNFVASPVVWPSAGVAVVELPFVAGVRAPSPVVSVGGLPVKLSPVPSAGDVPAGGWEPAPASVRVEVLDRSAALAGGVPLAVRISRADGGSGPAKVNVQVDYRGFRDAAGGGWAARLGLRLMPECGLSRVPDAAAARGECVGVPLPVRNNLAAGVLSADVDLALPLLTLSAGSLSSREQALYGVEGLGDTSTTAGEGALLVVQSGPDTNGAGNFTRTSLKESYTWSAGGSSGGFTFSYPMGVPPVPGGLAPGVGLGYSSGSVDGQTSSENTQAGVVGEGWSLSAGGFIESTYRPCAQDQDNSPVYTEAFNTCWRYENYQLSWGAHSGELVPTSTPNVWKTADDDGSKVEFLAMGGWVEHWKVTTPDGTQWFFGRQRLPGWTLGARETNSVLGHQVWANRSDEPCFNSGQFYDSHCWHPYRWMLDYVVDVNGNSMSYWYDRFTNLHGSNGNGWNQFTYDRDVVLKRIEYGTRAGNETNVTSPPAKVEFTNVDRCVASCWSGGNPVPANWPETPWDLQCGAPPCPAIAPTFWSHLRLDKVGTYVWTGLAYTQADQWQLAHTFVDPLPGVGTDVQILRLDSVTRTGFGGGTQASLPPVTLFYQQDRNRADFNPNAGLVDPQRLRLDYLVNESGGKIDVVYKPRDEQICTWWSGKIPSQWPDPDLNSSRCFPQYLGDPPPPGFTWWHKFVVESVIQSDETNASPPVTTSYTYSTNGSSTPVLWGYVDGSTRWATIHHSHMAWKGYSTVETTTGPAGAGQLKTKQLFFRGLDRDKTDAGEFARTSTITDSAGGQVTDHKAFAGRLREQIVYNGAAEVTKTLHGYPALPLTPTAGGTLPAWITQSERYAYLVPETATKTTTTVDGGPARVTETTSSYHPSYGTIEQVHDKGDVSIATDDICTTYSYARNTQDLMLRAGTGSGLVAAAESVIGVDWSSYDVALSPGDFNSDGKPDVLARSRRDSHLYLFKGNGAGGFTADSPVVAGTFWYDVEGLFSPGDWSGDGKPDVLIWRPDHNLYLARGNGTGGFSGVDAAPFGTGWNDPPILSVGDISGDAKPDVIYRNNTTGKLMYIRGNGTGGWIDGVSLVADNGDWRDRDLIFGKGDATGDGKTDLYARVAATGQLKLYAGNGNGTFAAAVDAGSGWNVYDKLLSAGDVNSDGKLDVLAGYGGARIVGAAKQVKTDAVACGQTPTYPADFVSDVRTSFDDLAYGLPPVRGLATKTETVKSLSGQNPSGFVTTTAGYDQYGRVVWAKDPLNYQTTTDYTHNAGGLLSSTKVTNPKLHDTTIAFDTARGLPTTATDPNGKVTTGAYDPLGRLTKVWQPGRPVNQTPNMEYAYTVSKTVASYVTSKALGPNDNQITSYDILDGFLRPRQTQTITEDGKRTIADTQYDGRGLAVKTSMFYNSDSGPSSQLFTPVSDAAVDTQQRAEYDGAGRKTKDQLWGNNTLKWQTETVYGGDRVGVIPPTGGTPIQDIFDARGRVIEKRQYSGTPFTGAHLKTLYGYDDAGRLTTVTDPANNSWTYQYDLLGRKTQTVDPDAGTSTATYDDAGQTISATDARPQTLYFEYDSLGRKTKQRDTTANGTVLAEWTYDTYFKGQLASTTRYVGADAYTTRVTDRDDGYRPKHTELVIPNPTLNGSLAATYAWDYTYKPNGAPATTVLPGVGGLPAETLTNTYDNNGYAQTLAGTWAGGGSQTYVANTDYTFDGLVSQSLLGAAGKQVKQINQYEAHSRRLSVNTVQVETSPGTFTSKFASDYVYDNAGNITAAGGFTNGVRDQVECFRYDYLRRLTEAWTQASTPTACLTPQRAGADPYWRQWTFDSIGNRLTQVDKDPVAGDTTWTYTVGTAGSVKPHQVKTVTATGPKTDTASRTFGYDLAGNTTTAVTTTGTAQTLTWDKQGHLATVVQGGNTDSYLYDADGNRLIVRTPEKTTLYLPDGTEVEQPTGPGAALGTRYYAGIAVRDAAGVKWICTNHQNTSLVQIDSVTLATSRRRSLPYGEDRTGTPVGWIGTKGYVGGTKDQSGLTHLSAREYDPTLGRFMSVDPVMDLADPQQWHGYAYANNNPITWSDPSGLEVFEDAYGGGQTFTSVQAGAAQSRREKKIKQLIDKYNAGGDNTEPPPFPVFVEHGTGKHITTLNEDQLFFELALYLCDYGNSCEMLQEWVNIDRTNWTFVEFMSWIPILGVPQSLMLADRAWKEGDYLGAVLEVAGVVPGVGKLGKVGDEVVDACRLMNSFDPETEVLMADGTTKKIRDVRIGDLVLATDPQAVITDARSVTQLHVNQDRQLTLLTVVNESGSQAFIDTTWEHPFWSETRQRWIAASELGVGERLRSLERRQLIITSVENRIGSKVMHNLTVAGIHTYYVLPTSGERATAGSAVLVHNCTGPARPRKTPSKRVTPPDWVKREGHYAQASDRTPAEAARRIMDEHYPDGWTKDKIGRHGGTGADSEYSSIQKYLSRYYDWSVGAVAR